MSSSLPVLNVHTPSTSFAIVHSLTQDTLQSLCDKLTRKVHTEYGGQRVGPGWIKYENNNAVWNLDDDSDYTIFVWRQQQSANADQADSISSNGVVRHGSTPTLHLHDPKQPLPTPPAYLNASYYLFSPSRAHVGQGSRANSSSPRPRSTKSRMTKGSKRGTIASKAEDDGVPAFKRDFEQFHGENGVRTVIGSIGPVKNVRMLLKAGYRHVYISRKFAMKNRFIPKDAAPGHYGYSGLVNIGSWPIKLVASTSSANDLDAPPANGAEHPNGAKAEHSGSKPAMCQVYLSEEQHFDVVLGRAFFEKRQIKTNPTDPTDIVCMDVGGAGEKIECELVILKDGRGQIVTVT